MQHSQPSNLNTTPITRVRRPFLRFLEIESSGGLVLLFCTVMALILANSPFADTYMAFWKTPINLIIGNFALSDSLGHWINDGLMTIFFFVVGLEIKRELITGELKVLKAAALPIIAALGGMIVPAIIYAWVLSGQPGSAGWGIPMATDIAFVVGFMAILGKRVPHGLKIFLLSLAIVDDIGAVIIIAIFYSSSISVLALSLGVIGFGVVAALNRLEVRWVPVYIIVGILIWLAFLFSGVHPTVAGVILGLITPARPLVSKAEFSEIISSWQSEHPTKQNLIKRSIGYINQIIFLAKESISPLERLENALHPWVAFCIMPLFALANAGIPFAFEAFFSPISIGVASGLFFGKVTGVVLFSLLAVKLVGSPLPSGTNWSALIGAGFLAGVGFTMSIFIASLALDGSQLVEGKAGTLLGSALSTIIGLGVLHFCLPREVAIKKQR